MSVHEYRGTQMTVMSNVIFIPGDHESQHHAITKIGTPRCDDFITINMWGKMAVMAAFHLYKGRRVNVTGELHTFTRHIKSDEFTTTEVYAKSIELLEDGVNMKRLQIEKTVKEYLEGHKLVADIDIKDLIADLTVPEPVFMKDFDPYEVSKTAKFGNIYTKVWSMDKGFWESDGSNEVYVTPEGEVIFING